MTKRRTGFDSAMEGPAGGPPLAYVPGIDLLEAGRPGNGSRFKTLVRRTDSLVRGELRNLSRAYQQVNEEKKVSAALARCGVLLDRVMHLLSRRHLTPAEKMVLGCAPVRDALCYDALFSEGQPTGADEAGVLRHVLRAAKAPGGPVSVVLAGVVNGALTKFGLADKVSDALKAAIGRKLMEQPSPWRKVNRQVWDIYQQVREEQPVRWWVEAYFREVEEIELPDSQELAERVLDNMVRFILERRIQLPPEDQRENQTPSKSQLKAYDEHFADAYNYAMRVARGEGDPIDAIHTRGSVDTWDFTIDTGTVLDEQEVIPENIRAASALFYIYFLGDRMNIFKLCDVLVLNWAAGFLDIVDGEAADRLYRYHKLRDDRILPDERAMIYRRVFGFGDAEVLSRMPVNEHYQGLWRKLMTEVTEYIQKVEQKESSAYGSPLVSRKSIELSARDIQYNLTEYAIGMVHMQTREMYAQLQEAIGILQDEQVLAHFGGRRRKNMWRVIEELSKQEGLAAPNVSALRTMAVEGYNILQYVADLGTAADTHSDEAAFQKLLDGCEAWIIAAGSEDSGFDEGGDFEGEGDEDGFEEFDSFDDEEGFEDEDAFEEFE
jgi:hypothetical protein